jgi:hypothetical protein
VSPKVHGGAGTYDLPLATTPLNPTTKPRQAAQTVNVHVQQPDYRRDGGDTEGTASAGAPTFSGNTVIVALTGVADHQYVTVALTTLLRFAGRHQRQRFGAAGVPAGRRER